MTEPATITGASILGGVLRDDANFVALVPLGNIKGGRIPAGASLPVAMVRTTSSIELAKLKRGAVKRMVDRITLTIRAASWSDQQKLIAMAQSVAGGRTGDIGGALRVAIRALAAGPDLDGPGDSFEQSTDFRVTYEISA